MRTDWIVVGAGFAGAVLAERIATQLGQKVLLVDKRNHIGGNAYDEHDENGVLVHKYGPHIFHTNAKRIVDHLSQFTDWRPYHHRVLAMVDGHKVPVPFNLNSLYALFPPRYAGRLEDLLIENYGFNVKVPILKMRDVRQRRPRPPRGVHLREGLPRLHHQDVGDEARPALRRRHRPRPRLHQPRRPLLPGRLPGDAQAGLHRDVPEDARPPEHPRHDQRGLPRGRRGGLLQEDGLHRPHRLLLRRHARRAALPLASASASRRRTRRRSRRSARSTTRTSTTSPASRTRRSSPARRACPRAPSSPSTRRPTSRA